MNKPHSPTEPIKQALEAIVAEQHLANKRFSLKTHLEGTFEDALLTSMQQAFKALRSKD